MFRSVIVAVNVYVIYLFKYIPVLPSFLRQGGLARYYRLVINLKYSCLCLVSVRIIRTNHYQRSTPPTMHSQLFSFNFYFHICSICTYLCGIWYKYSIYIYTIFI